MNRENQFQVVKVITICEKILKDTVTEERINTIFMKLSFYQKFTDEEKDFIIEKIDKVINHFNNTENNEDKEKIREILEELKITVKNDDGGDCYG